ncbi:MAG: hypothetical protein R6W82_10805 [bacterium]
MKKLFLFLLVVLVAAPPAAWRLEEDRTLQVVVVDESVQGRGFEEHAGFHWLLEHMRVRAPGGAAYLPSDYFGYYPAAAERAVRFTQEDLDDADLVYLADAFGTWRSGLEQFEMMRDRDRDEWIHSGFTYQEMRALLTYIQEGGHLVAEAFLFFARHPAGGEMRRELEEALGVVWTGWIGGWFKDLNNIYEVPFWVRGMYERNHGQQWPYRGPGVIFINPSEAEFVVLTPGIELRSPRPEIAINRRERALGTGVESNIPLAGWFEVVEAPDPSMVHASVRIQLTATGQNLMQEHGIPASFPLVVARWVDRNTYYVAADLGEVPGWLGPGRMKWAPEIRGRIAPLLDAQVSTGEQAFWRFYIPFMRNIVDSRVY